MVKHFGASVWKSLYGNIHFRINPQQSLLPTNQLVVVKNPQTHPTPLLRQNVVWTDLFFFLSKIFPARQFVQQTPAKFIQSTSK
jgi:hypothetical protein